LPQGSLQYLKGGAARPSLLVFCAGALLLAASLLPADTYFWWGGLALLVLAFLGSPDRRLPANLLSIGLALLCAWFFASAAFLTPHYSPTGLYRPLVLFGGFASAAVLRDEELEQLLRAATALLAMLVLIGLLQTFLGFWNFEPDSNRAAAAFATPNTFATAINLFLLPCVALAVNGRGGRQTLVTSLWLFAGLLSTESRGGWLAFLAGLYFIVAYFGLPATREARAHWLRMLAGLLWTLIAYYAMKALVAALPIGGGSGGGSLVGMLTEDMVSRGSSFRFDLARVALQAIAERPFAGAGANTFWPLYEMNKPPDLDMGVTFAFVHNDYLQTWVEFGLPGIVLLCTVMAAALAIVLKGRRREKDDPMLYAGGAACAGIFTHAVFDFPLYVPFPTLVLGAWLGVLAVRGGDASWAKSVRTSLGDRLRPLRTPLVLGAATVVVLAWLAQPAIGEYAARRALDRLSAGDAQEGVYWESVARRLEPQSGKRHWEEGVIWRYQALASDDKLLAAKADDMFAEGTRVDPYDPNNFIERARLNRLNPPLLERPASPEAVLAWNARALKLRPYMLAAQAEYARALAHAGRSEEARRLARAMLAQHPDSQIARRLAADM
jgi:O-antigen ligase